MRKKVISTLSIVFIFIISLVILSCDYYFNGLIDDWSLIGPEGSITFRIVDIPYGHYKDFNAYVSVYNQNDDPEVTNPIAYGDISIENDIGADILKDEHKQTAFFDDDQALRLIVWIDIDFSGDKYPTQDDLYIDTTYTVPATSDPVIYEISINDFGQAPVIDYTVNIELINNPTSGTAVAYAVNNASVLGSVTFSADDSTVKTLTDWEENPIYVTQGTNLTVGIVIHDLVEHEENPFPSDGEMYLEKEIFIENEDTITFDYNNFIQFDTSNMGQLEIKLENIYNGNHAVCMVGDASHTLEQLYRYENIIGETAFSIDDATGMGSGIINYASAPAWYDMGTNVYVACRIDTGINFSTYDYYDFYMPQIQEVSISNDLNTVSYTESDFYSNEPTNAKLELSIHNVPQSGMFTAYAEKVSNEPTSEMYRAVIDPAVGDYDIFDNYDGSTQDITFTGGDVMNVTIVYKSDGTIWDGINPPAQDDMISWISGVVIDDDDGSGRKYISIDYNNMIMVSDAALPDRYLSIELYNAYDVSEYNVYLEVKDANNGDAVIGNDTAIIYNGYAYLLAKDSSDNILSLPSSGDIELTVFVDTNHDETLNTGDYSYTEYIYPTIDTEKELFLDFDIDFTYEP